MERGWNWGFDRVVGGYRWLLQFNERHRWAAVLVLLAVIGMFVHSLQLAGTLGTSAFPESDMGRIYLRLEFPTRYSLDETVRRVAAGGSTDRGPAGTAAHPDHRGQSRSDPGAVERRRLSGPDPAEVLRARPSETLTIDELMDMVRTRMAGFPGRDRRRQPAVDDRRPVQPGRTGNRRRRPGHARRPGPEDPGFARRDPGLPRPGHDRAARQAGDPHRTAAGRAERPECPGRRARHWPCAPTSKGSRRAPTSRTPGTTTSSSSWTKRRARTRSTSSSFPGADGHPVLLASLGEVVESEMPIQITRKDKRRISKLTSQLDQSLPLGTAVEQTQRGDRRTGQPAARLRLHVCRRIRVHGRRPGRVWPRPGSSPSSWSSSPWRPSSSRSGSRP